MQPRIQLDGIALRPMLMGAAVLALAITLPSVAQQPTDSAGAPQAGQPAAGPPVGQTTSPASNSKGYSLVNGELVVAPGLRIPNGNVPWALDMVDGKQVLIPIHHGTAAAGAPDPAAAKLEGQSSHTALHSSMPSFFVHAVDRTENAGDSGRGRPTGWALVAAPANGGSRTAERPRFAEASSAAECVAPALCLTAESLPDGWIRLTPKDPLAAGEYALMPVVRGRDREGAAQASPLAYDFTVDGASATPKDAVSPGQDLDVRKKKR